MSYGGVREGEGSFKSAVADPNVGASPVEVRWDLVRPIPLCSASYVQVPARVEQMFGKKI